MYKRPKSKMELYMRYLKKGNYEFQRAALDIAKHHKNYTLRELKLALDECNDYISDIGKRLNRLQGKRIAILILIQNAKRDNVKTKENPRR